MAGSNVKGLDRILKRLREAIKTLDEKVLREAGEYVAKRMVMKARTGKTMISGDEERIKPLSKGYIEARKSWQKNGSKQVDSEFFSPKRSNLTATGLYLKSFKVITDPQKLIIVVEASGTRPEGLSNKELSGYLAKQGRNIHGIDKLGRRSVRQMILRALRRQIRKNVLKK